VARQISSVPFCVLVLVLQFIRTDIDGSTTAVSSLGKYYSESNEGIGLPYWQKAETQYRNNHTTSNTVCPKITDTREIKAMSADRRFVLFRL